jgi:hypothetical protein
MYLNEGQAKEAIQAVVVAHAKHTDDFKLYPVKRKTKSAKQVSVFFILKIKSIPENETLYNDFMKKSVDDENLEILESDLDVENKVLKEAFLIRCDISIFGV